MPLPSAQESEIGYCCRTIDTIQRPEARGALPLRQFRLFLRSQNSPRAFRRRSGDSKFALLLWLRHGKGSVAPYSRDKMTVHPIMPNEQTRSAQPNPEPPQPEQPKPQPPQPEIPPSGPQEPQFPSPDPEPLPTPVPGPTDPGLPQPIS